MNIFQKGSKAPVFAAPNIKKSVKKVIATNNPCGDVADALTEALGPKKKTRTKNWTTDEESRAAKMYTENYDTLTSELGGSGDSLNSSGVTHKEKMISGKQ